MFASCGDEAAGAVVGVFSGAQNDDDDWARSIQSIAHSDAAASRNDKPHVCVLVLQSHTPLPPPIWRKRMADGNKALVAKRYHFAVVCPNPIHRGVLTAILWLTGSRAGHHYTASSTFGEAAGWIRAETGESYPTLESLYDRAQAQLADPPLRVRSQTS